ncbi:MAG: twin-arginine translocation signal domain-containing protein [Dietzia sp.]|nr:twin-arginine translocation signal domain-containing protein [Dietzia sp.]
MHVLSRRGFLGSVAAAGIAGGDRALHDGPGG